jgi:hypothetical protein
MFVAIDRWFDSRRTICNLGPLAQCRRSNDFGRFLGFSPVFREHVRKHVGSQLSDEAWFMTVNPIANVTLRRIDLGKLRLGFF